MMIPTENVTFKNWVDSLRVDFNSESTIPYVSDNDDWRVIGNIIASSPLFAQRSVPTTENFPSWQEWGIILYDTMAR